MSSGIIGLQRLSRYLQAYVRMIWDHLMSSGIIGMQRLSRDLQAYVRIWDSLYIIWNYWNAAFVSIFTSICKDMGIILCHPELLECSICLDIYKHMNHMGVISCHPELLECSVCLDFYRHM